MIPKTIKEVQQILRDEKIKRELEREKCKCNNCKCKTTIK
jgi:hypothetical protein